MEKINEIKIPAGVDRISVTQHDDKIVVDFIREKHEFKEGDFVYEDGRIMIVKSYPNNYHASIWPEYSDQVIYNFWYGLDFSKPTFRYATKDEKQLLIDAMKKNGKHWNAEKLEIENITHPRFKVGDKVRIKDGISSKTHNGVASGFTNAMDEFIGKELTVKEYTHDGFVILFGDCLKYRFAEDWLEPYTKELKKGDLAIFWDYSKAGACIGLYNEKFNERHYNSSNTYWVNAIKFESKEQYEKLLRGEI